MGCSCTKLKASIRGPKPKSNEDNKDDTNYMKAVNIPQRSQQIVDVPDRPKEFGQLPKKLSEYDLGIDSEVEFDDNG